LPAQSDSTRRRIQHGSARNKRPQHSTLTAIASTGAAKPLTSAPKRGYALDFGAQEFVDLDNDALEDAGASIWCSMSSAATSRSGPQA
jgi:hypothetical protein